MNKGKESTVIVDSERVGKEGGGGGNGSMKGKAKPASSGDKGAMMSVPDLSKPMPVCTGRFDDVGPHSPSGDKNGEEEEGGEEVAGALAGGGTASAAVTTHKGKEGDGKEESAIEISDDLAFLMSLGEEQGREEGVGGGMEDEDDDLALLAQTRGDSEGSIEGESDDEDE